MTAPWCQWCDDIGHDEADCPDYERDEAADGFLEDRAQDRITLRDKGEA